MGSTITRHRALKQTLLASYRSSTAVVLTMLMLSVPSNPLALFVQQGCTLPPLNTPIKPSIIETPG